MKTKSKRMSNLRRSNAELSENAVDRLPGTKLKECDLFQESMFILYILSRSYYTFKTSLSIS
jgi:hypothetical protein